MSKRILILAATTGYQTREFAEAARRVGAKPVLATDQCHRLDDPWGDGAITVRFHRATRYAGPIAANAPFDGIVTLGDHPAFLAPSPPRASVSASTHRRSGGLPVMPDRR
jgi:hypothetical protein